MSEHKKKNDVKWNTRILSEKLVIELKEFETELFENSIINSLLCFIEIKTIEKCILVKIKIENSIEYFDLNYACIDNTIYMICGNSFNIDKREEVFEPFNENETIKNFDYEIGLEKIIEEFKIIAFNEYENSIKIIIEKLRKSISNLENLKNKVVLDYNV